MVTGVVRGNGGNETNKYSAVQKNFSILRKMTFDLCPALVVGK